MESNLRKLFNFESLSAVWYLTGLVKSSLFISLPCDIGIGISGLTPVGSLAVTLGALKYYRFEKKHLKSVLTVIRYSCVIVF